MAWSNSKIFRQYVADVADNVTAMDWVTDALVKATLWDTDVVPDNDVTAANSAYGAGQWVSAGNEVSDAAEWAVAGVNLATRTIDVTVADFVSLRAANTASGTSATLLVFFGCMVYDDTITTPVADQGFCYNYFGGTQSITDGTMTILWHTNGVMRYTL
jgi:hypothetical protein